MQQCSSAAAAQLVVVYIKVMGVGGGGGEKVEMQEGRSSGEDMGGGKAGGGGKTLHGMRVDRGPNLITQNHVSHGRVRCRKAHVTIGYTQIKQTLVTSRMNKDSL